MGAASTFPKPGRTCRRSLAWQLIGEDNDGRGFRLLPHRLEETYFERVPDGWLFAAPRPRWPPVAVRPATNLSADGHPESRGRLNRYLRAPGLRLQKASFFWSAGGARMAQSRLNPAVRPSLGRRGQRLREPHHEAARCRPCASRRENQRDPHVDPADKESIGQNVDRPSAIFPRGPSFGSSCKS
jgi:hypothetical protein